MKKQSVLGIMAVVALSMGSALAGAADQPDGAATSQMPNRPGSRGETPTAAAIPADWTWVKGTVQAVDPTANQVKIRDERGYLGQVTIDSSVVIRKNGKKIAFDKLQAGDRITLMRKKTVPSEQYNKG